MTAFNLITAMIAGYVLGRLIFVVAPRLLIRAWRAYKRSGQ